MKASKSERLLGELVREVKALRLDVKGGRRHTSRLFGQVLSVLEAHDRRISLLEAERPEACQRCQERTP